ncbi:MAG: molybdopterin guanine dinucleotide-containing S/N-oxide reductase [Thiomonas sp.]
MEKNGVKKVSRRTFVKTSAAIAAAVAARPLVLAEAQALIGAIAASPFMSAGAQTLAGPIYDASTVMSSSHWGSFLAQLEGGRFVGVLPFAKDAYPSPMIQAMPDRVYAANRVNYPMVRESYLKHGFRSGRTSRGREPFVRVSWDHALELVAQELTRVKASHGAQAIFGGSNGWRSAGKLHDASTLLHRFLGQFGGYVGENGGYSWAAAKKILPYVVGSAQPISGPLTTWPNIIKNTQLMVVFGSTPLKNAQILRGGGGDHATVTWIRKLKEARVEVISINPVAEEDDEYLKPQLIRPRPNTDIALMLGAAHTLYTEGLYDKDFISKYTIGFDKFLDYLLGKADGQPKDAQWASKIAEVDAEEITTLARKMAAKRTMIIAGAALQRASHGEQVYWTLITLAAMLGQIGLPGGGFGFGYGYYSNYGDPGGAVGVTGIPAGKNPLNLIIPTARISDAILNPGKSIEFNGKKLTYPDIRLVYWSGGNPFTHQQDTNKLVKAWQRPETIIVNEIFWTPTAKFADIVLPAVTELERNDLARAQAPDRFIVAMHRAIDPLFEARSDYDIFTALADRLGFKQTFTEGRSEMDWLQHFYETAAKSSHAQGFEMPDFKSFWEKGYVEFPEGPADHVMYGDFRKDPDSNPLGTPSGKIEIYSQQIASYRYDDCPPHPAWLEPAEWLGSPKAAKYPLHLDSPHPRNRLHSQLDNTWIRAWYEVNEREPVWINSRDAQARKIANGDVVRVYNDRGQVLAGAVVTDRVRHGVVRIAEGAWYDPERPGSVGSLDKHGNVNVLTLDEPASRLSQGSIAKTSLVQVEKYSGALPPITAFTPPPERTVITS